MTEETTRKWQIGPRGRIVSTEPGSVVAIVGAREERMYVEHLKIVGLEVWWRASADDEFEFWRELTPREIALAQSIMKNNSLLTWQETISAMLQAPP